MSPRPRCRRAECGRAPRLLPPSPLALAVRSALRRHAGLTSALTLGVMLSGGMGDKALAREATSRGGLGAPYSVMVDDALVVIDPSVPAHRRLQAGVRPGLRTVVLDSGRDGLSQIGALLAARPALRTLHLVTHGQPGALRLGNGWVRREDLEARRVGLSRWFAPRAVRPKLIVYGCNVAAGAEGGTFVERLSALTGADVAASVDATGASDLGGDWVLEHAGGPGDSPSAFLPEAMARYPHVLTTPIDVSTTLDVVDFGGAQQVTDLPGADGLVSLREAVIAANNTAGGYLIRLPAGTYTLTTAGAGENAAATGDLDISSAITIRGDGEAVTAIDAAGIDRVLHVLPGGSLTLEGTRVTGGTATGSGPDYLGGGLYNEGVATLTDSTVSGNSAGLNGGGIFNRGTATLSRSTVSGNRATQTGGGIFNVGTATLSRSTFSGNSAGLDGGGIYNRVSATIDRSTVSGNTAHLGGGIRNDGAATLTGSTVSGNSSSYGGAIWNHDTATLDTSTISGNTATSLGGGIYNYGGALTLASSTVTGNSAGSSGGGIANRNDTYYDPVIGTATLSRSIISGNAATTGGEVDNSGTVSAAALNIVGHSGNARSVGFTPGAGDIVPAGALATVLAPDLADNGGPTETHALVAGSPAIDAVPCAVGGATGQRGVSRPQGPSCDIGAVELIVPTLVTTTDDVVDGDTSSITALLASRGADTFISLREAVIAANNTPGADTIELPAGTYALGIAGAGEDLAASGDLDVADTLGSTTIRGAGAALTSIDAAGLDRALHVRPDASLVLEDATVTGGAATAAGSGSFGGGILNEYGTVTLDRSTVAGNSALLDGGGIAVNGFAILVDSTVSGNSAAGTGGGIRFAAGTATLENSTVTGNAAINGGGIDNSGYSTTTLADSTVSGNTASAGGGGIRNDGAVALTGSTVSGNSAGFGGGGIFNRAGTATLGNSTVSGNSAGFGGGIDNNATATLTDSTVAGNGASSAGGIDNGAAATTTLTRSLVAISTGGNCAGTSPITDGGNNLADDTSCAGIPGTLSGLDPILADNGGPTRTHALLSNSNAIDAVSCAGAPATDQRGVPRPQGPGCDIGAYEETVDTDDDGVPDYQDAFPLDPDESVDSDGDGMGDNFENRFGLDPNDPGDAGDDPDGDGISNLDEFRNDTDPTVHKDAPAVVNIINSIFLDD